MNLPVELWMRVFENIDHDNDCVRPKLIKAYNDTLSKGASEVEALDELPLFEKRVWRTTRAYYQISRNSRAAAFRLDLTCKLLAACKRPVMIATQMEHECDLDHIKELMPTSPPVVQLLHKREMDRYDKRRPPGEFHYQTMRSFVEQRVTHCASALDHVDHIILLPPSPHLCGCCPDFYLLNYAACAKDVIEESRRRRGVPDARIETFL